MTPQTVPANTSKPQRGRALALAFLVVLAMALAFILAMSLSDPLVAMIAA
jgi:uncharacterized protein involved in exopolysaccharide biosynthesis